MTKQVFWTRAVLESFIHEGNLNKRQEFIVRTRAEGYTISKQATELHLSIDQVNKEIAEIKKKYDIVQKRCPNLPPRCKNKQELFKG